MDGKCFTLAFDFVNDGVSIQDMTAQIQKEICASGNPVEGDEDDEETPVDENQLFKFYGADSSANGLFDAYLYV